MDAGNYTILARLGEGPLGAIYEGAHKQTQERVVVRVLPATLSKEPNVLGRLLALQRALARLEPERSVVVPLRLPGQGSGPGDPSVAGIIECGRMADGSLYVISEFVTGESLATQLRRHAGLPLPNKALRLGRQLSASLAVAHAANIHHLALRPEKVLLVHAPGTADNEYLKIIDLGLLTALGRTPRPEELPTNALFYLAPEYRRGEGGGGGPADVFALGVMLYEIGSGGLPAKVRDVAPNGGASRSSTSSLAGLDATTALMQMLPSWLQPFAELLDRMLLATPGDRPTMAQVAAVLQQLSTQVPNASMTSLPPSASTPRTAPPQPPVQAATALREPPPANPPGPPPASPPPNSPKEPPQPLPSSERPLLPAAPGRPEEVTSLLSSGQPPRSNPPAPAAAPAKQKPNKEPSLVEIVISEEPTLSSEPTHMVEAAPSEAATTSPAGASGNEQGTEGEIELQADYTLNPQRPPDPELFRALGGTSGGTGSPGSGTAGGRTAATPVEPGLASTAMLRVGQLVGNFRIVSKIGQGGMGAVYAAVHRQIGRRAAIKVLHGPLARTADYTARFLNEARAVNILRHPNLVEIFDFGQLSDGTLYIIMEFLEGESLRAKLRRIHKLPEPAAVGLTLQMARALEAAHQKGIVHRDLKPDTEVAEENRA